MKLKDLDVVDRRSHGCDGCRKNTSTERFDGYCGHYLWLCNKCFKKLVINGLTQNNTNVSEVSK